MAVLGRQETLARIADQAPGGSLALGHAGS
jgi:hypothetical protein